MASEREAGGSTVVSLLLSDATVISSADLPVPLPEGVWYGSSEAALHLWQAAVAGA